MDSLLGKFHIKSGKVSKIGKGHLNLTYEVVSPEGRFILQKVNTSVFTNPVKLMENVSLVLGEIPELYLVEADGKSYVEDEGGFWRMYNFVGNAVSYDVLSSEDLAYRTGKGLQSFHGRLEKLDASRLYETIPRFHDMRSRYVQLGDAVKADAAGRLKDTEAELGFLLEERKRGNMINDLLRRGALRNIVAHNDAKLDNLLFDRDSGDPITFIDLDTVMAGTVLYDLGDMIRSACSSAAEDEEDLSKVSFLRQYYDALTEGYLEGNHEINSAERELLPECGRMMAQIMAVRFLTDYLAGDVYYQTSFPDHNLVRCRNQIALILDMDRKLG